MSSPDPIVQHLRASGLAFASGVAATLALLTSPLGQAVGPIEVPPWPIDLRLLLLPSVFTFAHVSLGRARWPTPALVLPGLALLVAGACHVQASAIVDFLTAFQGSSPGERIDLVPVLASGASLVLALAAAMDRGAARMSVLARKAGATEESLVHLRTAAAMQGGRTLGFTAAALVALTLIARLGDAALGGQRAPFPELLGAAVAVGVAVLLFPGVASDLRRAAAARRGAAP